MFDLKPKTIGHYKKRAEICKKQIERQFDDVQFDVWDFGCSMAVRRKEKAFHISKIFRGYDIAEVYVWPSRKIINSLRD